MDTSVDPCDDFYKYSCGKWSREHPIPDTSLMNTWFSERTERVSKKIRDLLRRNVTKEEVPWAVMQANTLYTSCMDVESMDLKGLSPLFNLLYELDLPAFPSAFTGKTSNYMQQMSRVKRLLGRDVFFGLSIIPDPRNKTRNILYLDTPDTDSPLPSDKELEKRLKTIRSRLRRLEYEPDESQIESADIERVYMTSVLKEVMSNGTASICSMTGESTLPDENIMSNVVQRIYDVSSTVYYLSHPDDNKTLSEEDVKDEDYTMVDDLQKVTDEFILQYNSSLSSAPLWRPYIEQIFKDILEIDLTGNDPVLIGNLDYLMNIALILASTDQEDLESFIWWTVVDITVPHLSENLRNIWAIYIGKLMNVEVQESRSIRCASAVNKMMGMAVSYLYVDPSFHKNQGLKVEEMVNDIKEAFSSMVKRTDWMDRKTKRVTLEKNEKMLTEIGYPKWLFEKGKLDDYYKGINLKNTEYLDNLLQIVRLTSEEDSKMLHKLNDGNQSFWATDPTDVNAFHTFQVNQITVPAGILQFPFYELGLEALNYGAIGSILGHELTHGFDNSGRQYDIDGNLRQWWTNETISEYTDRTQCFIDHYDRYYEAEVDDYIDGELTLGENIADNGGLREAVIAYRRWKARHGQEPLLPGFVHLSHDQLLYLGFAHLWCESYTVSALKWMLEDTHCPGHVRLLAVLRNSKEFSETWKCPLGSNMNPQKKCQLW
ncbi:neprilysin-1 isoform X2 [Prorops nasuta]